MRTLTIRRGMALGLGLAVTLSMAACAASKPPSQARAGHSHTVAPAASPATAAPPPSAIPGTAPGAASATSAPPATAWLSASEIPFNSSHNWSVFTIGPTGSRPIGTPEGNGIYYVSPDTTFQAITSCGDPSLMLSKSLGAWQRLFEPTVGVLQDQAGQWISSYPSAAAAQGAWQRLQAAYAGCRAQDGNLQITCTKTAQSQNRMAWFTINNGGAAPDLARYTHEYFAVAGNEIVYVFVRGQGSALATTPDDAQVLATIAQHLAEPGGVQNLVISSAERSELTAAFVAHYGISPSDVAGTYPGSVYCAYDPATDTYWAVGQFRASSGAPMNVLVEFQDGGNFGLFRTVGTGPWQVQTENYPPARSEPQFFPQAVLMVWGLPTSTPAPIPNGFHC
jgi:hypothetical protein